jgi:FMN phosphatase YigB (HAD superfamily)
MIYRAVLFDLGNTLLEYGLQGRWREYAQSRLTEMHPLVREIVGDPGLAADEFAARVGEVLGPRARSIQQSGHSWHLADRLREGLADIGLSAQPSALERLVEEFCSPIRDCTRRYPETLEVLEGLRGAGVRLALISNTYWDAPGRMLQPEMEKWDIARFLDAMVMSGDVPWRKPNPEFMWAAARALGVEPAQCLVVGDSLEADIAGARAAGMRSVWVDRDGSPSQGEERAPDLTVRDLRPVLTTVLAGRG